MAEKYQNRIYGAREIKKKRTKVNRVFKRLTNRTANIIISEYGPYPHSCKTFRRRNLIKSYCSLWLAEKMNIPQKACQIGTMSDTKCKKAMKYCHSIKPWDLAEWIILRSDRLRSDSNRKSCGRFSFNSENVGGL